MRTRRLAEEIATRLFTMYGGGLGNEVAHRLVLAIDRPERRDLGGLCREAAVGRIEAALAAFQSEREAEWRKEGPERERTLVRSLSAQMAETERLQEREEELEAQLHRAESALRHHGYRKSCDIPACNCGDQWMHGGKAQDRLREIRDELGELVNGKTILGAVKDLNSQLHRALGEGAGLREAMGRFLQDAALHVPDGVAASWILRVDKALASAPLSERAGAVLEAAEGFVAAEEEYGERKQSPGSAEPELRALRIAIDLAHASLHSAVDALRAELAKGGE